MRAKYFHFGKLSDGLLTTSDGLTTARHGLRLRHVEHCHHGKLLYFTSRCSDTSPRNVGDLHHLNTVCTARKSSVGTESIYAYMWAAKAIKLVNGYSYNSLHVLIFSGFHAAASLLRLIPHVLHVIPRGYRRTGCVPLRYIVYPAGSPLHIN